MMNSFSLNNPRNLILFALIVVSVLFGLSRMPGGIGGTGISGAPGGIGGTGIYGRIDAFGSIWVNGVEIFYDENQNVIRQGRDGSTQRLSIGQIVAVVIDEKTGRAEAQSIEIIEEVSGLIEQLSAGEFIILGQKVILTDATIIDTSLINGEQVAINGLRRKDGIIVASRIVSPLIAGEYSLRGQIDRVEEDSFWVGDQEILRGDNDVIVGHDIEVRGKLDQRRVFIAEQFEVGEDTLFDGAVLKRNYQTIAQDIVDINQIKIMDNNIAPLKIEIDRPVNNISIKEENITAVKPLIREQIIETRIVSRVIIQQDDLKPQVRAEIIRQKKAANDRQAMQQDQRKKERIAVRRLEIQKKELAAANTRRLAAVAVRRQAIEQARQQANRQAKSKSREAFNAQELSEILRKNNIDAKAYKQVQENIRDRVQSEIRDGARFEARLEVRRRINEELRKRIRRQLRDRQ